MLLIFPKRKRKRALEQEIIFGTILEELDVDYIEEAKTGIDAEAVRLKKNTNG